MSEDLKKLEAAKKRALIIIEGVKEAIPDPAKVNDYARGRLYAASEIYFELTGEVNPHGDYVELVVAHDV
jgi:hypothetical protein